jgi:hypothetical protein
VPAEPIPIKDCCLKKLLTLISSYAKASLLGRKGRGKITKQPKGEEP